MIEQIHRIKETSFFMRIWFGLSQMMESSFIYGRRKKSLPKQKAGHFYYTESFIYKGLCTIGRGIKRVLQWIRRLSDHSVIVKVLSGLVKMMHHNIISCFNLFALSILVGYVLANLLFDIMSSYKINYSVFFCLGALGVNFFYYLYTKCKETSFIIRLFEWRL